MSPFSGTITSRVEKRQENASPTRSTIFNSVTLYLPRPDSVLIKYGCPLSLESLLHKFVEVEPVEDSTKQQSFAKLPNCLCFHIQRTGFDSGMAYKREDQIAFPLSLNMDQFVYVSQLKSRKKSSTNITRSQSMDFKKNHHSYQLCAIICHFGEIQTGHYVTYRKCKWPCGKIRWYYTSDSDVRQVNIEQVLAANPYILFYERQVKRHQHPPLPMEA